MTKREQAKLSKATYRRLDVPRRCYTCSHAIFWDIVGGSCDLRRKRRHNYPRPVDMDHGICDAWEGNQ